MHRLLKVASAAGCGVTALLLALLTASPATAQAPGAPPFSDVTPTPTTSPYLNLFNNGGGSNNNQANYQQLVRPQLEARNNYLQQQSQLQTLQRQVNAGRSGNGVAPDANAGRGIRATGGVASQYMNLSHYYTGSPAFRTRQ